MRGLLSWMQVVTSGKGTLGQVIVKGRGVMDSHPPHTQLPNNLHPLGEGPMITPRLSAPVDRV